jgi:hypothetical protein
MALGLWIIAWADSLPGNSSWSGSWVRTEPVPGQGMLTLKLAQGGAGTIRLTGSLCLSTDTAVTVALDGAKVKIEVRDSAVIASFVGALSGDVMSGTMTVGCRGLLGKGTWQAKKS